MVGTMGLTAAVLAAVLLLGGCAAADGGAPAAAAGHYGPVRVVTLPALRVACYAAFSKEPEKDSIQFLDQWLQARGLDPKQVRRFGRDVMEVPADQAGPDVRGYESWAVVPERVAAADGVQIRQFPGGLCAAAVLKDPFTQPFETIPAGWMRLQEWVEGSGKHATREDGFWLEEVRELGATQADWEMEQYWPIQAR